MEEGGGAQIRLRVPPVTRARRATASTQNTLVHPVELRPILLGLQILLPLLLRRTLPLQPRLDALILVIKVRHVHHQVLDHEHVRQRRDGGLGGGGRDLGEAGEAVAAVDVHGAGAADALAAGAAESEGGVDIALDLDEGVEDHGPTVLEVDLVGLELGFGRVVGAPPVDLEGLEVGGGLGGCLGRGF